ncbi:MarR family winged helix-turn-helix transcriptional regulator [Pseudarthrobacter sp. Fe7]|nr:MarR family winged helix-turn-helix transcriptional regulator [Pseudarthrobacter sp. Fe7]
MSTRTSLALARQAGTDVKMASQVLRALEAKGLIAREVDPADTRAKRLRVTNAGAEPGAPGHRRRRGSPTPGSSSLCPWTMPCPCSGAWAGPSLAHRQRRRKVIKVLPQRRRHSR